VPRPAKAAPVLLRCVGMSSRLISFVELGPCDCRYPYGGARTTSRLPFAVTRADKGSRYCTPHFRLTRRVGIAAERAAGPVMLRLVEAA
jgi:GcrA cell cycle regulator